MDRDESVTHAWNTVPVQVWIDADAGIAPLVAALNTIPGLRTRASCQGHLLSKFDARAYVSFQWANIGAWNQLVDVLDALSGEHGDFELKTDIGEDGATLYLRQERIAGLVAALEGR